MTEFIFYTLLFFIWSVFIIVAAHATLWVWSRLSDNILGGIIAVWSFLLLQGIAAIVAIFISESIAVLATKI